MRTKLTHYATSIAFLAGFVWDNIMLSRVDHAFANVMLGFYLSLSALAIIGMNLPSLSLPRSRIAERTARILPYIVQFCFGSLMSAYLVLYTRSASLASDWPFLLFLALLVLSNELFRARYFSIILPASIFFVSLYSYSIFSLPVLLGSMGDAVFVASGIAALGVFFIFALVLSRVAPDRFRVSRRGLIFSIATLYFLFNFAYFTKVIPPLPLALKDIGVYHSVVRTPEGDYRLTREPQRWYSRFVPSRAVFHRSEAEPVFVWSSVFAPTKLTVPILHRWQYWSEVRKNWMTTDLFRFSINGGRDAGYRGYTFKTGMPEGRWRVGVETLRGDLIGQVEFTVLFASSTPALVTILR